MKTFKEILMESKIDKKEKTLELIFLLTKFNDSINYFDKKMKNCYVDMLSFVASGNKPRLFTSNDYSPHMLEEVLENTIAYFDLKKYKHSELYYFEQEISKKGFTL